jgi:probable blue pigment (indigoidine) exporter
MLIQQHFDVRYLNIKITNMKATGTALLTVLAPVSWGTTYVTITELLPAGRPLLVAAMRVAPAAVVLLAAGLLVSRWRPRGADLWRTAALGACNFGVFFPLLVVAVYRLPGGVAAAVGGLQPLLVAGLTWAVAGARPRRLDVAVGCVAVLGVALVVVRPGAGLDPVGVLAAAGANVSFSLGVVLTKRFPAPPNRLAATGWQMLAGAAVLVPLAAAVEGAPPPVTAESLAGFAYLGLVATALAFVVWLDGVRRLPVPAPPLLGLAAPVTGAAAGWALLGEALSPLQLAGFVVTVGAIAHGATAGRTAGATATATSGTTAGPTTRSAAVPTAGPACRPANLTNDRVTTPQFCTVRTRQVPPQRALGNS